MEGHRSKSSVTGPDTDWVSAAVHSASDTIAAPAAESWQRILLLLSALTEEERHIGRPLRGHTKIGCRCRYCKSVLSHQIVLNGAEEETSA